MVSIKIPVRQRIAMVGNTEMGIACQNGREREDKMNVREREKEHLTSG